MYIIVLLFNIINNWKTKKLNKLSSNNTKECNLIYYKKKKKFEYILFMETTNVK